MPNNSLGGLIVAELIVTQRIALFSFVQIREAAQALLLAELRRIGPDGRRDVVEQWGPFLPSYVDASMSLLAEHPPAQPVSNTTPEAEDDDEDEDIFGGSKRRSFPRGLLPRRTQHRSKTPKHKP